MHLLRTSSEGVTKSHLAETAPGIVKDFYRESPMSKNTRDLVAIWLIESGRDLF